MKKINHIVLSGFFILLAFTSCEMKKEILESGKPATDTQGIWDLTVDSENEETALKPINTKGGSPATDVNNYSVEITNNNDIVIKSFDTYKDLKEQGTFLLEKGSYKVKASSGELMEAAFDAPVFANTETFVIEPKKITKTYIVCEMQNIKVLIKCSENFLNSFKPDFEVLVTNGKGILTFKNNTIQNNTAGYFKPGDYLKLTVNAMRINGNSAMDEVSQTFYLNEQKENNKAEAKDFYTVYLDVQDVTGEAGKPGISADLTLNERDETVLVPSEPEEGGGDNPGEGGGETGDGPALTTTGFEFGNAVSLSKAAADQGNTPIIIVDIDATEGGGIENLVVKIDSKELSPLLAAMGIPEEFDIAHLDADVKPLIQELGLDTEVLGKKTAQFDISGFMGPLALTSGTSTFTLTVTDKNGGTSTGSIIITVTD